MQVNENARLKWSLRVVFCADEKTNGQRERRRRMRETERAIEDRFPAARLFVTDEREFSLGELYFKINRIPDRKKGCEAFGTNGERVR